MTLREHWQDFVTSPIWLRVSLPVALLALVAALLAQMLLFPDGPIVERSGQFVGKYGAIHTEASFQLHRLIDRLLLAAALAAFALLVAFNVMTLRRRNRRDGSNR